MIRDWYEIKEAHAKLTEEVRMIFYPQLIEIEKVAEHFEKQKAAVLRFLQESEMPFPQGKYFSEIIAEKYHENIMPLLPMDACGYPIQDHFAVAHRQAFDRMHKVLGDLFDDAFSLAQSKPVGEMPQDARPAVSPIRRQLSEDMFERRVVEVDFEGLDEILSHPSEPNAELRRLMRMAPPWA